MQCDMCGADEELFLVDIDGARLNVCKKCSKFGKILQKPKSVMPKKSSYVKSLPGEEVVQLIVKNYSNLIKKKRESLGLKQKELAKKIAEKESVIHKLESGSIEPSIKLARKLEKSLGIKLIKEEKVEKVAGLKAKDSSKVTIGDMIKL